MQENGIKIKNMNLEFATYKEIEPVKLDLDLNIPNNDIFSPLFIPNNTTPKEKPNLVEVDNSDIKILKNTYFGKPNNSVTPTPSKGTWKSTYSGNKEGWLKDLSNAYRNAGIKNENAIRMLLAQDALESSWGKSAQGKFNFGNITAGAKWDGDIVVGNDTDANGNPIKQKFRNYNSLEDYAKDKVKFLKNLYDFNESDNIDIFTSKLKGSNKAKRHYAEHKGYKSLLTGVYNKLKFQQGGKWIYDGKKDSTGQPLLKYKDNGVKSISANLKEVEVKPFQPQREWLKNWYNSRTSIDKNNYDSYKLKNYSYDQYVNNRNKNLDNTPIEQATPDEISGGFNLIGLGKYDTASNKIKLLGSSDLKKISPNFDRDQLVIHELTHSINNNSLHTKESKTNERFVDNNTLRIKDIINSKQTKDKYWDNPSEINARLMEFRYKNKIDPNKVFTNDDIDSMRLNKNLIQKELINRYSNKQLLQLLNDVAQLPNSNLPYA